MDIKKMSIKEICNEIDLIIAGKDNRNDYKYIYMHLGYALAGKIKYSDIALVCETIIKIAKTKNRILRHLEKDFWSFINSVPLKIIFIKEFEIGEDEELLANTAYDNTNKRILSRIMGLVEEVIGLKDDHSKGSDLRRAGSLSVLGQMICYYHIPVARRLFVDSIKSTNKNEQYEALQGLENYYDFTDDEIEDDLVEALDDIKDKTDDRTVASTCLQIQINAGIIDEMVAVFEMDDWKDEHYYKR